MIIGIGFVLIVLLGYALYRGVSHGEDKVFKVVKFLSQVLFILFIYLLIKQLL